MESLPNYDSWKLASPYDDEDERKPKEADPDRDRDDIIFEEEK